MGTRWRLFLLLGMSWFLIACAIKNPILNQYTLNAFGTKRMGKANPRESILVTPPEAAAGYETEKMLYVEKPFALNSFVHNQWIDPPAAMLSSLIVQSLQQTEFFYAVSSSVNAELTNYRVDTQLLKLEQNFLTKPSTLQLIIKVVVSNTKMGYVIRSRLFSQSLVCAQNSPYGGVVAANQATKHFTAALAEFVVTAIRQDKAAK